MPLVHQRVSAVLHQLTYWRVAHKPGVGQYTAESIASGVGAVNEALEWMPVGVDKETPSVLGISREFMGKMTTEQQLSM